MNAIRKNVKAATAIDAHFCGKSNEVLDMTPSSSRADEANAQICFAVGECSLGSILIAQSECGICAITLGDDAEGLATA